jgi:hypothetical protein
MNKSALVEWKRLKRKDQLKHALWMAAAIIESEYLPAYRSQEKRNFISLQLRKM